MKSHLLTEQPILIFCKSPPTSEKYIFCVKVLKLYNDALFLTLCDAIYGLWHHKWWRQSCVHSTIQFEIICFHSIESYILNGPVVLTLLNQFMYLLMHPRMLRGYTEITLSR
jgi:hypothetical protein